MDAYMPLYDRFKKYFGYLNTGYQAKEFEVFAYNGGLFKPDVILDSILIDDQLLFDSCKGLSNYDFESEVDVNILGHIFEHSLSEIEKIEQELAAGLDTVEDPEAVYKSKRKKDGVFYTPRYITKYIVENTVGALCVQKREEMKIVSEDFVPQKRKANTLQLLKNLEEYRLWLLQLTICDPACGSGAFLNQALEFLIDEHQDIDAMKARLFGDALTMSDVETSILENNLYGVDINEEATDIAKLSLWLRTARKGRKLNDLNSHIKCGNSLIDDPAVAGDKAFNWQLEFPEVFAKGGFDVVIGNPPYVPLEMVSEEEKEFYKNVFPQLERKYDLSVVFILKSIMLINAKGLLSFISSVTWQTGENYNKLRSYLVLNKGIVEIINLPFDVFADAYVETGIYVLSSKRQDSYRIKIFPKSEVISSLFGIVFESIDLGSLIAPDFKMILNLNSNDLFKKINRSENLKLLGSITISTQGLSGSKFQKLLAPAEDTFPFLLKGQAYRYVFDIQETCFTLLTEFPALRKFYDSGPKLLVRRLISRQDRILVAYTDKKLVFSKDINPFLVIDDRFDTHYVLAILNSKLISYLYVTSSTIATKDDFRQTTLGELRNIPVPLIESNSQNLLVIKAELIISQNIELDKIKARFLDLLKAAFPLVKINRKLDQWFLLKTSDFLSEFAKQKFKLSLAKQSEWIAYFESERAKANVMQDHIKKTDREIDALVYELYGLTEEEIRIVEGS